MTADDLTQAARLLRVVADAEHARLSNDWETVTRKLDAVDPIEAYGLSAILDTEAAIRSGKGRRATDPQPAATRKVW